MCAVCVAAQKTHYHNHNRGTCALRLVMCVSRSNVWLPWPLHVAHYTFRISSHDCMSSSLLFPLFSLSSTHAISRDHRQLAHYTVNLLIHQEICLYFFLCSLSTNETPASWLRRISTDATQINTYERMPHCTVDEWAA